MAKKAKAVLSNNIYLEDGALRIVRCNKNNWVRRQVEEIATIDPLFDFEVFRQEIVKLKASPHFEGGLFELAEVGAESRFYGHLKALSDYADVPFEESLRLQFPYIEHGIRFQEDISPTLKMRSTHCVVSQGDYLKDAITAVLPGIPQFCIGPYIHYAKSLLSEQEIQALKRRLGKCLLVFPSHSIETKSSNFNEERLIAEIEAMADEGFDNVVCCFYWNDVDSVLVDQVRSIGAIPVSAGMRGDFNFICRLRSLIQISAAAAGNSLGTHIGYCLHLGIPYRWLNVESTCCNEGNKRVQFPNNAFAHAFEKSETLENPLAEKLFRQYWGGKDQLLSKLEMRCVFEITRDALSLSHGWSFRFSDVYRSLLNEYELDISEIAKLKYSMLSQSLEAK